MAVVGKGVSDCGGCLHASLMKLVQSRPKVHDLLCWVDPVATGIVFGLLLTVVILLRYVSILLLLAYTGLLGLAVVLGYKVFLMVTAKMHGKEQENSLKAYLDKPIEFPADKVRSQVDSAVDCFQKWINEVRRLFLIESFIDSLKLAVLLWALTYIGSWMSLSTVVILALIYAFTVPLIMEKHGTTINKNLNMVKTKVHGVVTAIDDKAPFLHLRQFLLNEKVDKKKE